MLREGYKQDKNNILGTVNNHILRMRIKGRDTLLKIFHLLKFVLLRLEQGLDIGFLGVNLEPNG